MNLVANELVVDELEGTIMIKRIHVFIALAFFACSTWGADGLVTVKSPRSVDDTVNRLEALVTEKGMTVFARIDHAAGAAKVGKMLRPTQLLIFGNPRGGTPLMVCAQTAAIDLPLKMLAWQDDGGQVWLAYNDPKFIAHRHGVTDCPVVQKMVGALARFAAFTVQP
jgi:uncharacterized protein (DUF302 family)